MTQNEIIIAAIRKCERARKNYLESQNETNRQTWERYALAVDVLAEIFEENGILEKNTKK